MGQCKYSQIYRRVREIENVSLFTSLSTSTFWYSSQRKMPRGKKERWYAVLRGHTPGIYRTLEEANIQAKGFKGSFFKGFPSESGAQAFLDAPTGTRPERGKPYDRPGSSSMSRSRSSITRKAKVPVTATSALATIGIDSLARDYYAVKRGHRPGVYTSWVDAEREVQGFKGATYKRFFTLADAQAYLFSRDPKKAKRPRKAVWHVDAPRKAFGYTPLHIPPSSSLRGFQTIEQRQQAIITAYTSKYAEHRPLQDLPFHIQDAREQGFTLSSGGKLVVWTDGSAVKNGKKGARAGSGVFWGRGGVAASLNISERLPGPAQTNNRAELMAIIRALETCPFGGDLGVEVRTDSKYCIDCLTQYLPIWIRNDFRLSTGEPVKNQDMIVHLLALLNQRGRENGVTFVKVKAHRGDVGNEAADKLATAASRLPEVPERTDWYTLEDVHRHAVMQRSERSVFATVQTMVERNRQNGIVQELSSEFDEPLGEQPESDEEIEDTEDDGEVSFTDGKRDENGDEEDTDDDLRIMRAVSNRNRRNLVQSDSDSSDDFDASDAEFDNIVASYQEPEVDSALDTAPSTCQQVEEVVSAQVELDIDPTWLLSQEEMLELEGDF
ncbi:hypothetical protein NCC49_004793 [Naganishia albida]|nr:hypothetical protein NCC49_004793 [Naganishia albida]